VLDPGSGDVSFCSIVVNMALRRGNPGKCLRGGEGSVRGH
jgi:hypothetical protein